MKEQIASVTKYLKEIHESENQFQGDKLDGLIDEKPILKKFEITKNAGWKLPKK